jgi:fucose permease
LILILLSKYPPIPKEEKTDPQGAPIVHASPFKNKLTYLYMFALGFGLFGEHGINNWFVNYMKEGFSITENVGATYLSIFFILFTIGRFTGGFLLEKIGYIKGVIYAHLITIAIYTVAISLGENGFALFSAAGILQAIIYPTIILTIPKVFNKNSAKAMSIIIIGASLINNLSSYGLGVLNDTIGVTKAFYMLPIQLSVSALAAFLIYQDNKKKLEAAVSDS